MTRATKGNRRAAGPDTGACPGALCCGRTLAMAKKPGIFSRLRQAISSTVGDAVDAMRDPGQEVALALDDLADEIRSAEKDLKQALVDRKVLERKLQELEAEVQSWARRAEQALKLGDEDLARAALRQKATVDERRAHTAEALDEQRALVTSMKEHIELAKKRHKTLELRRGTLMAQARASGGRGAGNLDTGEDSPLARLSAIEAKISEMEAMQEVAAELAEDEAEAADIDAKLAALSGDHKLDDELAALKARMRGERALGEGDD